MTDNYLDQDSGLDRTLLEAESCKLDCILVHLNFFDALTHPKVQWASPPCSIQPQIKPVVD